MEESDRTAIHEVMEQQTISISKAGIHTTLNARTSILAAANPLYGRYNPRRSITENINLPAALLSRFDIIFLILDRANAENDRRLAEHVTYVHTHAKHPGSDHLQTIPIEMIREYISEARKVDPKVPPEIAEHIVAVYAQKRQQYKKFLDNPARFNPTDRGSTEDGVYTSARFLLSVIRLSQALARLRFSDLVEEGDVTEALRLLNSSKETYAVDTNKQYFQLLLYNSTVKIEQLLKGMVHDSRHLIRCTM